MQLRVGQGIDVHRFAAGRRLVIGGVTIPYERGLDGHSDADVLLHSITDALLGAAGKGDLGTYFPDTDQKWKDADSRELLRIAWKEVKEEGWRVQNVDSTILAEAPRMFPHIEKMRENISSDLGITVSQCAIKATTTETIGAVGRKEGVMASSVILLTRE